MGGGCAASTAQGAAPLGTLLGGCAPDPRFRLRRFFGAAAPYPRLN